MIQSIRFQLFLIFFSHFHNFFIQVGFFVYFVRLRLSLQIRIQMFLLKLFMSGKIVSKYFIFQPAQYNLLKTSSQQGTSTGQQMMQVSKKKHEQQINKTSRKNHGSRQYISVNNQYHIQQKQPKSKSKKRSNDIIIDISNLKRSSYIEYQYYYTKSKRNKNQQKQQQKSSYQHQYGLDFKQTRHKQQKKTFITQSNTYRPHAGKIVKNFHNEKLTQATLQTPNKLSRKRYYSQSYSSDFIQKIDENQDKITPISYVQNQQAKICKRSHQKREPSFNYNTLIQSESKKFGITASANDYFCQINIRCKDKLNKKIMGSSSKQKLQKNYLNYPLNERYQCSHHLSEGNRKRSQTVAVNTTDYTMQQKPFQNRNHKNEVFHEYHYHQDHGTKEQIRDPADDKTCLSKSALLEEVIYLRNLALKLYQEKQARQRKGVPETIQEYVGYEG